MQNVHVSFFSLFLFLFFKLAVTPCQQTSLKANRRGLDSKSVPVHSLKDKTNVNVTHFSLLFPSFSSVFSHKGLNENSCYSWLYMAQMSRTDNERFLGGCHH